MVFNSPSFGGLYYDEKVSFEYVSVGIATQNDFKEKFISVPENVINFFFLIADEVREIMANLGIKKFNQLIGRSDLLCKQTVIDHWKAKDIDLTKILWKPKSKMQKENFNSSEQTHDIEDVIDLKVINESKDIIQGKKELFRLIK